jgi:hypothetical protein
MKTSIISSLLFALVFITGGLADEPKKHPGRKLGSDYDLEQSFDPAKLRSLVKLETRSFDQNRRLWQMIVQAGLKKDTSIQDLVTNKKLRGSDSSVDLALSAYEYMINEDERALDHILAFLATERVGADTDTIIILSAINEWDRSIRAFKKHFYVIEGTGAANYHGFLNVRRFLYPEVYPKHKKEIEANPRK